MDVASDDYTASVTYHNDEDARKQEADIVEGLQDGEFFEDEHFPADGSSLYFDPHRPEPGSLPPTNICWRRCYNREVLGCAEPKTLPSTEESSHPSVVQGALSDAWLLNALAMLSRERNLLQSILVSDRFRDRGIVTVAFYKNGVRHYVHVDDRIPCRRSGAAIYGRSVDPNETWVMIIEKAYAKLHGCYENLRNGHLYVAVHDLTGLPVFRYHQKDAAIAEKVQKGLLWDELKRMLSGSSFGCCMGCLQSTKLSPVELRQRGTETLPGRTYNIIELVDAEHPSTQDFDAFKEQLVKLSDPWRQTNWTGRFSEGDPVWDRYPDLASKLVPYRAKTTKSHDQLSSASHTRSYFWMSFKDLLAQFDQITACAMIAEDMKCYKGRWKPGDQKSGSGGPMGHREFLNNPQYAISLVETATVAVQLHLLDKRWKGGQYGGWIDGKSKEWIEARSGGEMDDTAHGFCVLKLNGNKPRCTVLTSSKFMGASHAVAPMRTISGMLELLAGRYAIVPFQGSILEASEKFVLHITTNLNKAIQYEQQDDILPAIKAEEQSDDEGEETSCLHPASVPAPDLELDDTHRHTLALYEEAAVMATTVYRLEEQLEELNALVEKLKKT